MARYRGTTLLSVAKQGVPTRRRMSADHELQNFSIWQRMVVGRFGAT